MRLQEVVGEEIDGRMVEEHNRRDVSPEALVDHGGVLGVEHGVEADLAELDVTLQVVLADVQQTDGELAQLGDHCDAGGGGVGRRRPSAGIGAGAGRPRCRPTQESGADPLRVTVSSHDDGLVQGQRIREECERLVGGDRGEARRLLQRSIHRGVQRHPPVRPQRPDEGNAAAPARTALHVRLTAFGEGVEEAVGHRVVALTDAAENAGCGGHHDEKLQRVLRRQLIQQNRPGDFGSQDPSTAFIGLLQNRSVVDHAGCVDDSVQRTARGPLPRQDVRQGVAVRDIAGDVPHLTGGGERRPCIVPGSPGRSPQEQDVGPEGSRQPNTQFPADPAAATSNDVVRALPQPRRGKLGSGDRLETADPSADAGLRSSDLDVAAVPLGQQSPRCGRLIGMRHLDADRPQARGLAGRREREPGGGDGRRVAHGRRGQQQVSGHCLRAQHGRRHVADLAQPLR